MKKDKTQGFDMVRTRITPEYARELLLKNTCNRNLSWNAIKRHIVEMKAGRWKFNGDTVRISSANVLLDGQHKLHACAESGVTIECILVKGLAPDVFDTIDTGRKRSGGDIFGIRGEKHATLLASVLSVVHHYQVTKYSTHNPGYPATLLEEVLDKNPTIRRSVAMIGNATKKTRFIPGSVLASLHYLFSQLDGILADAFVDALVTGTNLDKTDPIFLLRERLINNQISKGKLPPYYIMALTIKTWNAVRKGKSLKVLVWKGGSANEAPEPFPIIE